ncbi:MAG TPA: hypothetical protein VHV49_08705 [Pseudonocardiaceae bacterium]|jgi:hypothetical protein|nr:hypothetical protein [Pseudonocardiaceae bacterium]
MSPTSLLEKDGMRFDQIVVALNGLPWGQEPVLRQLIRTLAHYEHTGDLAVIDHFIASLEMTARMERNPAYLLASTVREEPGEPLDLEDVIAGIEARHRGDGT